MSQCAFRITTCALLAAALLNSPGWAQQHSDAPKKSAHLIRSAKSGVWSSPATWEGRKVPGSGDSVQVQTGHIVIYDTKSENVIRMLHVAGTLSFAPNQDTVFNVGLIKIQAGHDRSHRHLRHQVGKRHPHVACCRHTFLRA